MKSAVDHKKVTFFLLCACMLVIGALLYQQYADVLPRLQLTLQDENPNIITGRTSGPLIINTVAEIRKFATGAMDNRGLGNSTEKLKHILQNSTNFRNTTGIDSKYIDVKLRLDPSKLRHKLLWWNEPKWMVDLWDQLVDMSQCEYTNCDVTSDRNVFAESSAVMFSIVDRGLGRRPPVQPTKRDRDQAWIFFSLESPAHLIYKEYTSPDWQNAFNWSWTYRRDSDIFHPYGILQSRDSIPEKNYTDIFRKKTRFGTWLVSHCNAVSSRDTFIQLLQKYINIDVYGACSRVKTPANIMDVINTDYKFYFAMENSLCKDYVTEKFFHYYKKDLITVVRGSSTYNNFLPNGTFINTADFSSTKALGEFLKQLANNEEEYIKYLRKKDKYEVKEREFMYRNALCEICARVNNVDKYRRTYRDVSSWLGLCFAPNDLHRKRR